MHELTKLLESKIGCMYRLLDDIAYSLNQNFVEDWPNLEGVVRRAWVMKGDALLLLKVMEGYSPHKTTLFIFVCFLLPDGRLGWTVMDYWLHPLMSEDSRIFRGNIDYLYKCLYIEPLG